MSTPFKVSFFALYASVESSFGNDLELIQRHLDAGDQVNVVTCLKSLNSCDRNIFKDPKICDLCVSRSNRGINLLHNKSSFKRTMLEENTDFNINEKKQFFQAIESIENLKSWKIENFDIGYAVLSSFVSFTKDPFPDLRNEKNISILLKLAEASSYLFGKTKELLANHKPNIVYVFNGRYAPMRAIVRACEQLGIKYYTHDRGYFDLNHFTLFENTLPHDRLLFSTQRDIAWKGANEDEKIEIAKNWFENKAKGSGGAWKSFTDKQKTGSLPIEWGPKRNITIFTSSENEFVAIGKEWEGKNLFVNQIEGIQEILNYFQKQIKTNEITFIIRIHPNQKNAPNEVEDLMKLKELGGIVLEPDSEFSTYTLIKESHVVVTFGSSVGIEAVYWGTPSILLGQCYYNDLDATWQPESKKELFYMLLSSELESKPKSTSYPHAYRMATFGEPYKYYSSTGLFTGTFNGKSMSPQKKGKILRKIKNKLKIKLKNIFDS